MRWPPLIDWEDDAAPPQSPQIDVASLRTGSPLVRTVEIARFSLARFEHWLSPRGSLRNVIRWLLQVLLIVAIPAIIPLLTSLYIARIAFEILSVLLCCAVTVLGLIVVMAFIAVLCGFNLFRESKN